MKIKVLIPNFDEAVTATTPSTAQMNRPIIQVPVNVPAPPFPILQTIIKLNSYTIN